MLKTLPAIFASLMILVTACTSSGGGDDTGDDDDMPPGVDAGGPTGKRHGDICIAPAFDCGSGTNLVCVVDFQGDDQGVCRFSCGSFSDCLNHDPARDRFDTDCCDIGNGGQVCGMSSQWPDGACD